MQVHPVMIINVNVQVHPVDADGPLRDLTKTWQYKSIVVVIVIAVANS